MLTDMVHDGRGFDLMGKSTPMRTLVSLGTAYVALPLVGAVWAVQKFRKRKTQPIQKSPALKDGPHQEGGACEEGIGRRWLPSTLAFFGITATVLFFAFYFLGHELRMFQMLQEGRGLDWQLTRYGKTTALNQFLMLACVVAALVVAAAIAITRKVVAAWCRATGAKANQGGFEDGSVINTDDYPHGDAQ
jgi:hypothetical protein